MKDKNSKKQHGETGKDGSLAVEDQRKKAGDHAKGNGRVLQIGTDCKY